jgi:aminopeptidase YwaD
MERFQRVFQRIWQICSGEAAWQTVADLSRLHRIQASPGHRRAATMLHRQLTSAGLAAEILSYPADEHTRFWAYRSFQEWDCQEATLELVAPQEQAGILADFRACPISLIQRSAPFEGEVDVLLLEDGEKEGDYEGRDIAGKVVLTRGDLRRVWQLAVQERGAVGILFDGMRVVPPVRPEGDLADVRQYTSFWWQPGDTHCFGFVLTPGQGRSLRRLLGESQEPVHVRARVVSALYDGGLEVVSAAIPGESRDEIVVVAHLCHPQPSANDNASGAAAALEAARTLQTLIQEEGLRLRRTIRFLWLPELTGSVAYLAGREGDLERLVAGLNLDMVGEDQNQTGSSWLIERPPDAAASFAPDLLIWLRDQMPGLKGMVDVAASHTHLGTYPLYRQAEVPFSGGSDHLALSDPTVGVPTPMIIQWPDRFYHTSADTPDRTDPHSLARAGALAAAYACWLATAGVEETRWLGYQMVARYKAHIAAVTQAAVTEALVAAEGPELARQAQALDRRLSYLVERQKAALATLERLEPVGCLVEDLQAEVARVTQQELSWAQGLLDLHAASLGLAGLPTVPEVEPSDQEREAAGLAPRRQVRGPVPLGMELSDLDAADQEAWRRLTEERKGVEHTLTTLALYWADGRRSVLDIVGLVEMEAGVRDVELLLAFFRLLEKAGRVVFV